MSNSIEFDEISDLSDASDSDQNSNQINEKSKKNIKIDQLSENFSTLSKISPKIHKVNSEKINNNKNIDYIKKTFLKRSKWDEGPTIKNVFAEAFVGHPLDLRHCAQIVSNFKYPHESTSSGILALKSPKASVLAHLNGKISVIGMPSVLEAKVALRSSARRIQKAYPGNTVFKNFKVTQIGGSAKIERALDLEEISKRCKDAIFNIEVSNSLVFDWGSKKIRVYKNGTAICNADSVEAFFEAFEIAFSKIF